MKADRRVVACNYGVGISSVARGALAYVVNPNPGGGGDRVMLWARSRSGRWVEKWEDRRRLVNFRPKTIPPEHPMYDRLENAADPDRCLPMLVDA